jgi:hypothetical protein
MDAVRASGIPKSQAVLAAETDLSADTVGKYARPLRLRGNARRSDQSTDETSLQAGVLRLAATSSAILTPWYRVQLPGALIDQVVILQAHSRQPLLQGCVADAEPGRGASRLAVEMADEQRHVLKRSALSVQTEVAAETKVLIETAAVGINSCCRATQVAEESEPGPAMRLSRCERIVRPDGSWHRVAPLDCERILQTAYARPSAFHVT